MAIGFEFNDMLPDVATAYPSVKFLQIDSCPFNKLKPNIYCSVFREYEANYLAGAEAALTSKTGKVGAIGALDIPFLHRYTDGFIDGAKHVKPDIKVSPTLWVGGNNPFSDPARGQERAAAMLADGADRILAAGAGSNGGIFKAFQDVPGAAAFGVDVNQCPQAPGVVMDNVEKKTDVAVELAVKKHRGRRPEPGGRARPQRRRHDADRARRRREGLEVPHRRLPGRDRQGEDAARSDRQRRGENRRSDAGEIGGACLSDPELETIGLVKRYGGVLANDRVDLAVASGEIHAVMGENGAGKSTLMSMLYGLQRPDEGRILLRGREVRLHSPLDAIAHGIGMVHQAFKLFPSLTVWENIVFGAEPRRGAFVDARAARAEVDELARRHGLRVDPDAVVGELSVGVRQRVEILKALYRRARILILDEPTAVLTPRERDGLFAVMRRLADEGRTILFVTHKLHEVMAITDRVTVLRDGRVAARLTTSETSPSEIVRAMTGRNVDQEIARAAAPPGTAAHRGRGTDDRLLRRASRSSTGCRFRCAAGEIVGVAGRGRQRPERTRRGAGGSAQARRRRGAHRRRARRPPRASRRIAAPASPISPRIAPSSARRSPATRSTISRWAFNARRRSRAAAS